jgi:hypothetical protein
LTISQAVQMQGVSHRTSGDNHNVRLDGLDFSAVFAAQGDAWHMILSKKWKIPLQSPDPQGFTVKSDVGSA